MGKPPKKTITMMKRKQSLFLLMALLSCIRLAAQHGAVNYNNTYVDNIGCVRFGIAGYQNTFPLLELGSDARLQLDFDDFDSRAKTYVYRIVHCDMDWTPSNLSPLDYLDGYEEDYVRELSFSFQSIANYAHYELQVPNDDTRITKSGNYLLTVYEDEDVKRPVITRRFVVVDRQVGITAQLIRAASVDKLRTHHEIDFAVDPQRLTIRNPLIELRATVVQNGRWDNAIYGLPPNLIKLNSILFDYQNRVVFPAGNEFRFLDFRSLRNPNRQTIVPGSINVTDQGVSMDVQPDRSRAHQAYFSYADANGDFVIENFDQGNADLTGDYVDMLFEYRCDDSFYDYDLYLIGNFTEWQLKPAYAMVFNPAVPGYVGKARLKQGYYNYAYVLVPREPAKGQAVVPDWSETEGNFYETENEYHIFIYYRPVGGRYDQVLGVYSFRSWR